VRKFRRIGMAAKKNLLHRDPIPVESFGEFVEYLEEYCREEEILFRGQRNSSWTLLPKIARIVKDLNVTPNHKAEKKMFDMFRRKCIPYLDTRVREVFLDLLTVAQHNGLPTRLLDWTRNPLAALWFAVREPASGGKCGAVWVLDHSDEAFQSLMISELNLDSYLKTKGVRLYCPSDVSQRLIAQSGWFTVHGVSPEDKDEYTSLEESRFAAHLQKLVIPAESFKQMRFQLDRCGINEETLFRDLGGLCRYVEWYHTYLVDEKDWDQE